MIVIGIDPSLTSTGIAVVDTLDRLAIETRTVTSTGHRDDAWPDRWWRIARLAKRITDVTDHADLVVIEAPSLGQARQGGHFDRHGLWWAVYGALVDWGVDVLVVSPAVRAKWATGRGNADKAAVLLAIDRRYPQAEVDGDDVADAVALATLGARLAGEPIEEHDPPRACLDALAKVVLQFRLDVERSAAVPPAREAGGAA